jgi:hypothetical protein
LGGLPTDGGQEAGAGGNILPNDEAAGERAGTPAGLGATGGAEGRSSEDAPAGAGAEAAGGAYDGTENGGDGAAGGPNSGFGGDETGPPVCASGSSSVPDGYSCEWRAAKECLKELAEEQIEGGYGYWGLDCAASPVDGNWVLVYAELVDDSNNSRWKWSPDPQGGAGSHLTLKDGVPYVVNSASNIWVKLDNAWLFHANNKCEDGDKIQIQQNTGDPAIAVGDNANVWVVESDGDPVNTVRHWNGLCWERLPELPASVKAISIWGAPPAGQRDRPFVVTTDGSLYQFDTSNQWRTIPNGWGEGVGGYRKVIGLGSTTLWSFNYATQTFRQGPQDLAWTLGEIKQITQNWVLAKNGTVYHWEG